MSSSEPPRKAVAFSMTTDVRYIEEKLSRRKTGKSPNMSKQIFERFDGHELTDSMLNEAAQLFNENYGTWGTDPTNPEFSPKPGKLV